MVLFLNRKIYMLNWVYPVQCFPLESADGQYHSCSLNFQAVMWLKLEPSQDPSKMSQNWISDEEWGSFFQENGRSQASGTGTWESWACCCATAEESSLLPERCCIPKHSSSPYADSPHLSQVGTWYPWTLAWAKQAILINASICLWHNFSLVKINKVCFRNFCQHEWTWQKSPWLHSAVTWKNPICVGACETCWRRN